MRDRFLMPADARTHLLGGAANPHSPITAEDHMSSVARPSGHIGRLRLGGDVLDV